MLLNFFSDLHNFQLTLCAPVGLYKDKGNKYYFAITIY